VDMEWVAVLIPITAILMPLGIVALASNVAKQRRELLSRERIAAIEKGLDVPLLEAPEPRKKGSPFAAALVTAGAGLGICIALKVLGASLPQMPSVWAAGLVPFFVGLGMLLHWSMYGKEEWRRDRELDEELRRAYIDRLRGSAAPSAAKAESPVAD
jgi:hypothetical protein